MSLKVYYLLDQRSAPKRNKSGIQVPIRIDVKYEHEGEVKHLRFPIGIKGNPKCFVRQVFTGSEPNAAEKNEVLLMLKKHTENIYLKGIQSGKLPPKETFKAKILEALKDTGTEKTIIEQLDGYIEYMTARQNAGRIRGKSVIYSIKRLKNVMSAMYKKKAFTYDTIDKDFETRFLNELQTFSVNTISTYTKRLKMFLNWATVNNLNRNNIYKTFEMPEENREIVALSETEVQTIADLDIPTHKNIKHGGTRVIRDWFIISTQTGLRFSDLHKIAEPELITVAGGFDLKVKTKKTGAVVVIPVSPILYRIFKEHDFNVPLPPSNQKYNRGLEKIQGLAKLNKDISSHTGRKTFCTTMYKKGYPVQWIMKISGHATEKEFYRYIGVDGSENAQLIRSMGNDFVIEHTPKMAVNK
jgi:integrase